MQGIVKKALPLKPLISVITVTFNAEDKIEQTIKSVVSQSYTNIEYIVIDGGSTDKTLEILGRYSNNIDLIVSEPDDGITDAMNKGITYSLGDYVLFIHAGDYFLDNFILESAIEHMGDKDSILVCDILFGKDQKRMRSNGFGFLTHFKLRNPHQGILCAKTVFNKVGYFDCDYKICADYDFFLRAYKKGFKSKRLPIILTFMDDDGVSSRKDWKALYNRFTEEKKIHKKNVEKICMKLIYQIYWFLYLPYRKMRYLCDVNYRKRN